MFLGINTHFIMKFDFESGLHRAAVVLGAGYQTKTSNFKLQTSGNLEIQGPGREQGRLEFLDLKEKRLLSCAS